MNTARRPSAGRPLWGGGALAALVALIVVLSAPGPARAAMVHAPTATFGSDGTSASIIVLPGALAYDQDDKRLYVLGVAPPREIHAFSHVAAGTFTPLPDFPLVVSAGAGDPDIAVDNVAGLAAGNLYYAPDNPTIEGFSPAGNPLSGFPVGDGGELCGVTVDNAGNLWAGNYGMSRVQRFSPTGGVATATVNVSAQGSPCRVEVDRSTNDLYVSMYGGNTWRYTAASGYAAGSAKEFATGGNAKIAFNPLNDRLYAAGGGTVRAFDGSTGALVEQFGSGSYVDVAVDDDTDTVFVTNDVTGKVEEWRPALAPDVTTGDPIATATVSGAVSPAGGGPVTECYFEYGIGTGYGQTEPCSPAAPYAADQAVTAVLSDLEGEVVYHYRLVAKNANATNFGADRTILVRNVEGLETDPADAISRTSATVKGSFVGTGEETNYYFEWGETTAYGSSSAAAPGPSIGVTTGPTSLSFTASGLDPDTTYHYRVVASNSKGASYGEDRTFTTLPAVLDLQTLPATDVSQSSLIFNGQFTGTGDDTHYYFEWGPTASYGSRTAALPGDDAGATTGPTPVSTTITDFKGYYTYHYRVVASNGLGVTYGSDRTVVTLPGLLPEIFGTQSAEASSRSATLRGSVTPNRSKTRYWFEYGPGPDYGASTEPRPVESFDDQPHPVVAEASGLAPGAIYHYRMVASNLTGTVNGPDRTFATPFRPAIESWGSGSLGPARARLQAQVVPNSRSTSVRFEYGVSRAYGHSTPARQIGSGTSGESVPVDLTGLAPGTVYHFRVVAENELGTTFSPDRIFRTHVRKGLRRCGKRRAQKSGKCGKNRRKAGAERRQ